jgi:hypothetical protein
MRGVAVVVLNDASGQDVRRLSFNAPEHAWETRNGNHVSGTMRRIVLYGVGSPLVIDAEEACGRAGVEIVAGVRNVDGPVYVIDAVRVIAPAE